MQVSTESGGIPQKAVDGSTSAFFSSETCTLTKQERSPWWYVNLLEPYMVQLVRLDFGKPCCGANKPATIVVRVGNNRPDLGTNPICNRFTGFLEEGQPLFLPCNPPMPGAFVSVHLEAAQSSQLSICEAFVYTDQALPIERCPQFRDQPPGSTATYNGKCYIFYNRQPLPFLEAATFCRQRGGTLVSESNPALQGFISWELWRRHRGDAAGQYWLGAIRDRRRSNGLWRWLESGDEVAVSFWNLPLGSGECGRYDGTKGWLWADTDCEMRINYICQHQPKACGRPEQPPNSTMVAPNFNVGTTIEYTCDEGHLLVGPTTRTCLETGFYNEFPPVCKRIQCGYPASIPNGEYTLVNDSVGYLSRVIYSCDEGFEMIGRAQLACDIDERWNGPPPRCDPIHCEAPLEITNGITRTPNETVYGSVVQYNCNSGYRLVGPSTITCMANGQYDALPPTCEPEMSTTNTETPRTTRRPTQTTATMTTTLKQRTRGTKPPPTTIRGVEIIKMTSKTKKPQRTTTTTAQPGTTLPPLIVHHPEDNEIAGSSNVPRIGESPSNLNVPLPVDGERRETFGAKLNLGAIVALGAFGGFIFLAAIITTIVILVRRNQSAKHYRHRVSPDCNTVGSFSSSSSGSRHGGLNRYYRQAWENLHESAGSRAGLKAAQAAQEAAAASRHSPLRRKETLDEPYPGGGGGGEKAAPERKRHHHHHHHHEGASRGRVGGGANAGPLHHHKRY
nr:unnamed protein product [Callosobruchus chinensis]